MYEKGVALKIGGKDYNLVFTLGALMDVTMRLNGISEMAKGMETEPIKKSDTVAEKARKAKKNKDAAIYTMQEMPWLIALLANQGLLIEADETNKPVKELLTPEKVRLRMKPIAYSKAQDLVMEAIAAGMKQEEEKEVVDGIVDLTVKEIDSKNVKGAEK